MTIVSILSHITALFSSLVGDPQPVFVNLLRSPGINSQPGGPVRQPYLSYRPARLPRLAKSIPRLRFLVSIKVYKYGLWDGIKTHRDLNRVRLYFLDSTKRNGFRSHFPVSNENENERLNIDLTDWLTERQNPLEKKCQALSKFIVLYCTAYCTSEAFASSFSSRILVPFTNLKGLLRTFMEAYERDVFWKM